MEAILRRRFSGNRIGVTNRCEHQAINYGSFMMVHIKDVKKDFHDKALTLSTTIIQIMNADSKEIDRQSGSGITVMWFDRICVNA